MLFWRSASALSWNSPDRVRSGFAILTVALLYGGANTAVAQDAAAEPVLVAVMDQPRPDFDAKGIAIGDWLFFPALAATANYDNNVFREPHEKNSDWLFEATPSARLQHKMGSGVVEFFGDVDQFTYARYHQLDLTDWTAGANTKVTSPDGFTAAATGYYGEYHESFESADIIGKHAEQRDQTRYFHGHLEALLDWQVDNWGVSGGGTFDRLSWKPTNFTNGKQVPNTDRDEVLASPYLKLSYRAAKGVQVFVRGLYDSRDFDQAVDRSGYERSSQGYHLQGGLALALGNAIKGEVFAGWLRQDFALQPAKLSPLPDVSELDYGAMLDWYTAPNLTFHLAASRTLSDIILPGVSVSDDQSVRLGADWQPLHNVIVQGFGAYTRSSLIGSNRTDEYPTAGITVRFLINRYASLQGSYFYNARQSTAEGVDYRDQLLSVGINLHI